jgi:predicted enzyme related to lactoylglutathione lyase
MMIPSTTHEMRIDMLRGLTTVSFYADDLIAAKDWYAELLGVEPYFQRPADGPPGYVEFRVGDYQHEFGLIDRRYAPPGAATEPAGAIVYWHVDDVNATLERLLSMGAQEHEPITVRGEGFITASIVDPFGNILGIMYNAHYLSVLEQVTATSA